MKSLIKIAITFIIISFLSIQIVDARWRIGSKRFWGYNSHGKWSHYYGWY